MVDVLLVGLLRATGNGDGLLGIIDHLVERIGAMDEELVPVRHAFPALVLDIALTLFRLGEVRRAREVLDTTWFVQRSAHGERETYGLGEAHADVALAAIAGYGGDMRTVAERLDRVDPATVVLPELRVMYHYARAWQCVERSEIMGARAEVSAMEALARHSQLRCHVEAVRSFVDLGLGRAPEGVARIERFIGESSARSPMFSVEEDYLHGVLALLQLVSAQVAVARQTVAAHESTALSRTVRAVIELAAGRPELTLSHLVSATQTPTGPRVAAASQLLCAAALHRTGKEIEAADAMARMAALMAEYGVSSHLALVPRTDLLALRDLLAQRHPALAPVLAPVDGFPEIVRPVKSVEPLSHRETVVLTELATTDSARDLALRLSVSRNTVKSQLRSIYRKLGVSSREDAIAAALREGLIDVRP